MSLEKAIEANTLALQNLLAALTLAAARSAGCEGSESTFTLGATTDAIGAAQPADKVVKPIASKTVDKQWTYDELRTDFLALVKSNKPAALAILASFNVATLTELKDKETFYPAIAAKIVEARNG